VINKSKRRKKKKTQTVSQLNFFLLHKPSSQKLSHLLHWTIFYELNLLRRAKWFDFRIKSKFYFMQVLV